MLFSEIDGWTCVAIIKNDRLHINEDAVLGVKHSDEKINSMRSNEYYNLKVKAYDFEPPKNDWIDYPHVLYFTRDYQFSSILRAIDIKYSNRVSLSLDSDPIDIKQKAASIGFACGDCGDTFFSYGSIDENSGGLYQSFSGSGTGSVWVR